MRKPPASKKFVWRMPSACDNCPFSNSPAGTALRVSLRRMPEIQQGLLAGEHFLCHKTLKETGGDGSKLVCAGALEFQHTNGLTSPYEDLCKSFEGANESKDEMFRRLKQIVKGPKTRRARAQLRDDALNAPNTFGEP